MKIRFLLWDYKEQIDIDELNKAVDEVFNGKIAPSITDAQFDGDSFAAVVSSDPLTKEEARIVFRSDLFVGEINPQISVAEIDLLALLEVSRIAANKQREAEEAAAQQRRALKANARKKLSKAGLSPEERQALFDV